MRLGFGIGICTLLYRECMVNEGLLSITGNSTQYLVITSMGKESEKQGYVYKYHLSHFV